MSFRQKTFSSLKWSGIENFVRFVFSFVVSVILARLLNPEDFGLVAMISIFIALSRTLVDGGFGDSLIRKVDCSEGDYNTIFTFNVFLSIILYLFLFLMAPLISSFYGVEEINLIVKVTSLGILFSSLSIVQVAIIRKKLEFKKQAIISFITTLISGILSILFALLEFKHWSLIVPSLIVTIVNTLLLWKFSSWRPKFNINFGILKEHFSFGSKIMFSSMVHTLGGNIYNTIIGKFFTPIQLGLFNRADNIQKLPSSNLDNMVRHITYPLLASISKEESNLVSKFKTILKYTVYINATIMFLLNLISDEVILLLYGSKWIESVVYLKILCFVGILQPIISVNANLLNVKGRSEITLYALIINLILTIPTIFIGYYFGLIYLCYAILVVTFLYYNIISYFVSRYSGFSFFEQVILNSKSLSIPLFSFVIAQISIQYFDFELLFMVIFKILLFLFLISTISIFTKSIVFFELFDIIKSRVFKSKN